MSFPFLPTEIRHSRPLALNVSSSAHDIPRTFWRTPTSVFFLRRLSKPNEACFTIRLSLPPRIYLPREVLAFPSPFQYTSPRTSIWQPLSPGFSLDFSFFHTVLVPDFFIFSASWPSDAWTWPRYLSFPRNGIFPALITDSPSRAECLPFARRGVGATPPKEGFCLPRLLKGRPALGLE